MCRLADTGEADEGLCITCGTVERALGFAVTVVPNGTIFVV